MALVGVISTENPSERFSLFPGEGKPHCHIDAALATILPQQQSLSRSSRLSVLA